jgi:DNA-binding transcriptional LysR family regulator
VLTDAGSSYVAGLKRILADISERAASGEYTAPTGELVVTAPVGLGRIHLVPVVAEFLSAYPDITVRLVLGDRILNLPEEHVDVALRLGVLPDSRLMALRLGSTSRVVCASPAYLGLHGTPAAPEDVAGHDCMKNSVNAACQIVSASSRAASSAWRARRQASPVSSSDSAPHP